MKLMEPKTRKRRVAKPAMDSVAKRPRPAAKPKPKPKPAPEREVRSSHVIDLRQQAPSEPDPIVARPKPAPKLKPVKAPKVAAAPKPTPLEEPVEVFEPELPSSASSEFTSMSALPRRRFWPAFWRFLVLLVVLGLIVVIGIYLYLNYYHT